MKRFFACVLMAAIGPCFPVAAEEEVIAVDSLEAEFDGTAFQLKGDVHLQYDLGEVCCESASLRSVASDDEHQKNTHIQLRGDVVIKIHGGGSLKCALAQIDCAQERASFFSENSLNFVCYEEMQEKKGGESVPLTIQSREMYLKLLKCKDNEVSHEAMRGQVDQVEAEGEVCIVYDGLLRATGGSAVYTKCEGINSPQSSNGMNGVIVLTPAADDPFCHLTLKGNDHIDASMIRIDTSNKQVFFQSPRGKMLNGVSLSQGDEIEFHSDTMVWDGTEETLTLEGNIQIYEPSMGTLITDNQLVLTCEEVDGHNQVRDINLTGRVVINRFDLKKSLCYMLTNDGTTFVDQKKMTIEMKSLAGKGGDQAHFRGLIGEVYSDAMVIGYTLDQKAVTPSNMILEGNVKLLNNIDTGIAHGEDVVLQYALADKMEYSPHMRQLLMSSETPHRVLFFDKINNIQISAPGLKVTKNQETGKEMIKGVGDVRFRFLEQEIHHLKKRFFFQDRQTNEL